MTGPPIFAMISVSLDGFIEDREKAIDWMTEDRSVDALHTRTLGEIDGMIFGRKAHAAIAEFWMAAADRSDATAELLKQTERMTTLPKYVLTHGAEETGWVNSHAITLEDVPRLKANAVKPLAVFAGAGAIQALLGRQFVDELRLIRYPVVLGGGTPLFSGDGERRHFDAIDTTQFESGALLERFRTGTNPTQGAKPLSKIDESAAEAQLADANAS